MSAPEPPAIRPPSSVLSIEQIFDRLAPPDLASHADDAAIGAILTALQQNFGYVDSRAIAALARRLNLPREKIYGVLGATPGLRRMPPSDGVLKICRAEACRQRGADALILHLERHHGLELDAAAKNGQRLETAYCLGACGRGPNMLISGVLRDGLDAKKLDALLAAAPKF